MKALAMILCCAAAAWAQSGAPAIDRLMAFEKQAIEASAKGDKKILETLLSDGFVLRRGQERLGKAAATLMTAERCDLRSLALDEPTLTEIDADTYVLIYRKALTGTCGAGTDAAVVLPGTPQRSVTVWVRSGKKWLAAFHGTNTIVDPKDAKFGQAGNPGKKRRDAVTRSLAAVETAVWVAWKDHDRAKLERLVADSVAFVDIFGNAYANRPDIINAWSSSICLVKSVDVTDAIAYSLSPNVKLLTHIGSAGGTCYGEKIGPIYGNSLYVRDGKGWKLAFTMNMPAM